MSRVAGVGHGIVTGSNARMCRPGMPLMARRFPGELARPSPPSEADSLVLAAAVAEGHKGGAVPGGESRGPGLPGAVGYAGVETRGSAPKEYSASKVCGGGLSGGGLSGCRGLLAGSRDAAAEAVDGRGCPSRRAKTSETGRLLALDVSYSRSVESGRLCEGVVGGAAVAGGAGWLSCAAAIAAGDRLACPLSLASLPRAAACTATAATSFFCSASSSASAAIRARLASQSACLAAHHALELRVFVAAFRREAASCSCAAAWTDA